MEYGEGVNPFYYSLCSTLVFAATSSPIQVIQTRLQTSVAKSILKSKLEPNSALSLEHADLLQARKRGIFRECRNIVKETGMRGYFRGAVPNMIGLSLLSPVMDTLLSKNANKYEIALFSMGMAFTAHPIFALRNQRIMCPTLVPQFHGFSYKSLLNHMVLSKTFFTGAVAFTTMTVAYDTSASSPDAELFDMKEENMDKNFDAVMKEVPKRILPLVAAFILTYPFQTISSNQNILALHTKESMFNVAKQIIQMRGISGLYAGFGTSLLKMFPLWLSAGSVFTLMYLKAIGIVAKETSKESDMSISQMLNNPQEAERRLKQNYEEKQNKK